MSTKYKIYLTAGLFLIVLAIVSFYLAILNQTSRWYYFAGAILLTLGIIVAAATYIQLAKSAPRKTSPGRLDESQSSPQAPGSDLLRNAQQSAPQAPLKDRQTPQERAFPPDKDQQA